MNFTVRATFGGSLGVKSASALLLAAWCGLADSQIAFEEVTDEAGMGVNATESYGASWGDFNRDGYPDLYLENHRAFGQLWRNNANGTLTDVSNAADVSKAFGPQSKVNKDMHGSSWADIDNDGDQDLALTWSTQSGHYLISDGVSKLTDQRVSQKLTLTHDNGSRIPLFFDSDSDGRLDVKVIGTRESKSNFFRQQSNGTFTLVTNSAGITCPIGTDWAQLVDVNASGTLELLCGGSTFPTRVINYVTGTGVPIPMTVTSMVHDAVTGDFNNDLRQDILHVRGGFNLNGLVQPLPNVVEAHMESTGNQPQTRTVTLTTTGALSVELDAQNWNHIIQGGDASDVYIGTSGYHPSNLSLNLDPSGANLGIQQPGDREGLFVGYVSGKWTVVLSSVGEFSNAYFVFTSSSSITATSYTPTLVGDLPIRPKLDLNMPNGFVDGTASSGLTPERCVSGVAADFDNDMDLDVFLGCRAGASNISDVVFENVGAASFLKVLEHGAEGLVGAAITDEAGVTDSVVSADYDLDGFIDIAVTNGLNLVPQDTGGRTQLFRNLGNSNHWLQFDLVGVASNRDGVGGKVLVTAGGLTQYREQNGGYHRWSQNHSRLHFGLASNTSADVTIQWPSGAVDTYAGVASDEVYVATEDTSLTVMAGGGAGNLPELSVSPVQVPEAEGQVDFVVNLIPASTEIVTVNYATSDGTAADGLDYTGVTDTLTFNPGETSLPVVVPVLDDAVSEGNENFTLTLSGPTNAMLTAAQATGTIQDDEVSPCGTPTIDAGTTRAAFIWQDCATSKWFARFTAGGSSTTVTYNGNVTSTAAFTLVQPVSIESTDVLNTSNPSIISYVLKMIRTGQDGFNFTLPVGASACIAISTPTNSVALLGVGKVPVTLPFRTDTLGPC